MHRHIHLALGHLWEKEKKTSSCSKKRVKGEKRGGVGKKKKCVCVRERHPGEPIGDSFCSNGPRARGSGCSMKCDGRTHTRKNITAATWRFTLRLLRRNDY